MTNDLWPRLEAQLRVHAPDLASRLRPGAKEAAVAAYEAETGQRLPDDLRLSYLRHDGCDYLDKPGQYSSEGLLGWLQWLPLDESLEQWRFWNAMFNEADPYFYGGEDDSTPWSGMRIRPWTSPPPSWLPVGRFLGASPGIYVDTKPGPAGVAGQLVRADIDRRVEATGWRDYLAELTRGLEQGVLEMYADKLTERSYWRVIATGLDYEAPGFCRE